VSQNLVEAALLLIQLNGQVQRLLERGPRRSRQQGLARLERLGGEIWGRVLKALSLLDA
jgi:hypothetical protein